MLPMLAGALATGLGWGVTGAVLAGGITGLLTNRDDPLMGAVSGGLGGYGAGNLTGALAKAGALPTAADATMATVGGASSIPNTLTAADLATSTTSAAPGTTAFFQGTPVTAPTVAEMTSLPNPLLQGTSTAMPTGLGETLSAAGRGLAGLFQEGGFDKFKTALGGAEGPATTGQAGMALGMPAFNVASSLGLFDPQQMEIEEDDDRYKPLNLNQSSGLKLYANGGSIQTGGLMDLYGASDAQYGPPISQQGYGIGRLNNLASQASQARAEMGSYAKGGVPTLQDGGFVVPADVTFYIGGHDTEEGQEKLARKYGGIPIRGEGNGLSDDIETSIEGRERARVADGEVYIPREVVAKHGGPEKFYKMMDRVRKQATGTTRQARKATV